MSTPKLPSPTSVKRILTALDEHPFATLSVIVIAALVTVAVVAGAAVALAKVVS